VIRLSLIRYILLIWTVFSAFFILSDGLYYGFEAYDGFTFLYAGLIVYYVAKTPQN